MADEFKRGDQIVYIPNHANGDVLHPDCEFGFVMNTPTQKEYCWCRYWYKNKPGMLRTTANSELTPVENMRKYELFSQDTINQLIIHLDGEPI